MDGSREFLALNREAGLAVETAMAGLEALSSAHGSRPGLYLKAFFNLSTSIERIGKLVVVIDYALQNGGTLPGDDILRRVGHDIGQLNTVIKEVRKRYPTDRPFALYPTDNIVPSILECLSDFAKGARYYNLDFLVGGVGAERALGDPVSVWYQRVGVPVLAKHYPQWRRVRDQRLVNQISSKIESFTFIRGWSETGSPVDDINTMMSNAQANQYIRRWTTFYVCRLFRYYTMLLKDLSFAARLGDVSYVPWMGDHFGGFVNDDEFFKGHKVWRY